MTRKITSYSLFFSSFMFIQLVFLRLGNKAGMGFLPGGLAEHVYYLIQVFVIAGFAIFAAVKRKAGGLFQRVAALSCVAVLAYCALLMIFVPSDTFAALFFTAAGAVHLGFVGGCVYLKMAEAAHGGVRVGICMAVGCSAAILLQYVFQLRWNVAPLLAVLSAAAAAVLAVSLFRRSPEVGSSPGSPAPDIPRKTVVLTVLIAAALLLFPSFYNGYIHHLQITSGYTDFNVYSWPRLTMIPAYLLFGAVATVKRGKFLPITALCAAIVALLNSVLVWSGVGYLVNMCLFYVAIAASVAYYDLAFWKIAMRTKRPEIWASAGRVLDSVCVLAAGAARVSALPVVAVVSVDVALLAATIVLMALNGDFNFAHHPVPAPPKAAPGEDPFAVIKDRYGFTDGELRVFRELVLTEDKQAAVGDRLSIKLRTVQANVTSIYRKTGASTRSGLVQIYRDTASGGN